MQYNLANPSYALAPLVKQYWAIESVLPENKEHIQRIIPNGLTEMNFYFGDIPEASENTKVIESNTVVSGQLKGYYDLKVKGHMSLFSILFQPYTFSILFNVPASEVFNHSVSLRDLLPGEVAQIEDALFEAPTFRDKVAKVESFLLHKMKNKNYHNHFQRIYNSIKHINFQKGLVNIDYLAKEACFSRKQFERVFSEIIGTTPKQFLKTIRFQNALLQKSAHPELNLTALSYEAGYYDQSHMNNDFLKLSGMTPKNYFKDYDPISDYFFKT